ncbi:MAG: hypothetical protein DRP58_06780 [Spirochaetes bacterium]|nr:MAG: hypothetical protein DRP58_06780 [Spirochaetota bacterium]
MTKDAFKKAMDEYYEYREWDRLGRPTIKKLKKLKIEEEFIKEYKNAMGMEN